MVNECGVSVICVLGGWGSGTTSVAGYLQYLGSNSCPPYLKTTDPNTPNTFESNEFRLACLRVFDETTLSETGSRAEFIEWFNDWILAKKRTTSSQGQSSICLKHPLSAFLIREIAGVVDTKWVLVTRKFSDIEKTRKRRKWHPTFGVQGAQRIYSRAINDLISNGNSYLSVAYEDFRAHKEVRESLIHYVKLKPTESQLSKAEDWIK